MTDDDARDAPWPEVVAGFVDQDVADRYHEWGLTMVREDDLRRLFDFVRQQVIRGHGLELAEVRIKKVLDHDADAFA